MSQSKRNLKSFFQWLCPWFFEEEYPEPSMTWGIAYKDSNGNWVHRTTRNGRIITTYENVKE